MKLFTTRSQILNVAKRWREVYGIDGQNVHFEKLGMYVKARALERLDGRMATPEDVKQIVGNDGWTKITCDECDCHVEIAVQLGEEPDHESRTAMICFGCIHAAHKLFPLGTFQP